jgi:hypothetical protein
MNALKIELRKVSLNKRLSEETFAYAAQIWVDGRHFCDVQNHGQGGMDMHYPPKGEANRDFQPRLDALEKRIAAEYPKNSFEAAGKFHTCDATLETVCGDLLARREVEAQLRRDLKRKVLWLKDGKVWQVTMKGTKGPEQVGKLIEVVKQKHGVARTLNEMPFDEALAVYESA